MKVLDCKGVSSENEFWDLYIAQIRPDGGSFFGRNLDAFWDALTGGPGWPGDEEIVIKNSASLAPLNDGQFLIALRDIARDCATVTVTLV